MPRDKDKPLPLEDDDDEPVSKMPANKSKDKKQRDEEDDEPVSKLPANKSKGKKQRDEDDENPTLGERWKGLSNPGKFGIMGGLSLMGLIGLGCIVLIGLAINKSMNRSTAGSGNATSTSESANTTSYRIQRAQRKAGVKALVTKTTVTKSTAVVGGDNASILEEEHERYIEHILEVEKNVPTKLTRAYQEAYKKVGEKRNDEPYSGGTVTIEKKGDLFTFRLDERQLSASQAREMGLKYQGKTDKFILFPDKALTIGEQWTYDKGMMHELMKDDPTADPDKSSMSGKLIKVFTNSGVTWGVLDYKIEMVTTYARSDQPVKLIGTATLEIPIEGSSIEEKGTFHLETVFSSKGDDGKTGRVSVEISISHTTSKVE